MNFIPFRLIFSLAILGVLLFCSLWLTEKILRLYTKTKKHKERKLFYFPVVKGILWVVFILFSAYLLSEDDLEMVLFMGAVCVAVCWAPLSNFVQGLLFRLQRGDITGANVLVEDTEGIIRNWGITSMQIQTAEGNLVAIPYTKLYSGNVAYQSRIDKSHIQTLMVAMEEGVNCEKPLCEMVKRMVILHPYVATTEEVEVAMKEDGENRWLKIIYSLGEVEKVAEVNEQLRKNIEKIIK